MCKRVIKEHRNMERCREKEYVDNNHGVPLEHGPISHTKQQPEQDLTVNLNIISQ